MRTRKLAGMLVSAWTILWSFGCGDERRAPEPDPVGNPPSARILGFDVAGIDLGPCAAALCTIPNLTDFEFRMTGQAEAIEITGFQWRLYPWRSTPGNWRPFEDDEAFAVARDTTALGCEDPPCSEPDTLWSVSGDVFTVHQRNRPAKPLEDGVWTLEVRVRDAADRVSPIEARDFVINFDPHTELFAVPECDCPQPPPDCDPDARVPAGWVTGIGEVDFLPEDWLLFCDGDTLPNRSTVRFYAGGRDDPRDAPVDPSSGLADVELVYLYVPYPPHVGEGGFVPYSDPPSSSELHELPPGWGTFFGATVAWKTCPFDYEFVAKARDEAGRRDGRGARIQWVVGAPPVISALEVPRTIVFVPTCPPTLPVCPDVQSNTFGPDTLVVFGEHVPESSEPPWHTPYGIGRNIVRWPIRALGHDDPRDRNPVGGPAYYSDEDEGRIRSWQFAFDCVTSGCEDVPFQGEDVWIPHERNGDPPSQQVFDRPLTLTVPLDTLCVAEPCSTGGFTVGMPALWVRSGTSRFTLRAKDADFIGGRCEQPCDLGANAESCAVWNPGRRSRTHVAETTWLLYHEVRPRRLRKPR